MKCLIIFMRLACERRRASEIGIADSCNDLGVMAWAVAPELVKFLILLIEKQSPENAKVY